MQEPNVPRNRNNNKNAPMTPVRQIRQLRYNTPRNSREHEFNNEPLSPPAFANEPAAAAVANMEFDFPNLPQNHTQMTQMEVALPPTHRQIQHPPNMPVSPLRPVGARQFFNENAQLRPMPVFNDDFNMENDEGTIAIASANSEGINNNGNMSVLNYNGKIRKSRKSRKNVKSRKSRKNVKSRKSRRNTMM